MKRTMAVSLSVLLLMAGCGMGSNSRLEELQRNNEDLTRRVKALEEQLLENDKKIIQHEVAMKQMYERLKDMENAVNKIEMGPQR
jgi:chromosome segregation ATPase